LKKKKAKEKEKEIQHQIAAATPAIVDTTPSPIVSEDGISIPQRADTT